MKGWILLLCLGSCCWAQEDPSLQNLFTRNPKILQEALQKLITLNPTEKAGAVQKFCEMLRSSQDAHVLIRLAYILRMMGADAKEAIPVFIQEYSQPKANEFVRNQFLISLTQIDSENPEVITFLKKALEEENGEVKTTALRCLTEVKSLKNQMEPYFLMALKDRSSQTLVILLLQYEKSISKSIVASLIPILLEQRQEETPQIFELLKRAKTEAEEAVVPLLQVMKEPRDHSYRGLASELLGEIGVKSEEVLATLLQAIQEEELWYTRIRAAKALKQLDSHSEIALKTLLQACSMKKVKGYNHFYEDVLLSLEVFLPQSSEALEKVQQALQSSQESSQFTAAIVLGKHQLETPKVIPLLIKILESEQKPGSGRGRSVSGRGDGSGGGKGGGGGGGSARKRHLFLQMEVVKILGKMGPTVQEATPALKKL